MHAMIAKIVSENQRDWDNQLPAIAFAYRNSVQEATGFTPYYLMFGSEARIPADLIYVDPPEPESRDVSEYVTIQRERFQDAFQRTRQHLHMAATRRKRQYDLRARPQEFPIGCSVWFSSRANAQVVTTNGRVITKDRSPLPPGSTPLRILSKAPLDPEHGWSMWTS